MYVKKSENYLIFGNGLTLQGRAIIEKVSGSSTLIDVILVRCLVITASIWNLPGSAMKMS